MKTGAWARRLAEQLPGWHIWYSSSHGAGWYGVPSPAEATHTEALELPYRLGPYAIPQELRAAARERYADGDTCQTCNDDWRLCGHRQPEASR